MSIVAAKQRIPLIVTELFLKYAIDSCSESGVSWKCRLPLLGVCREWRNIALPLVYDSVYFIGASENGTGMNAGLADRYSQSAAGKTNIGLVKSSRNTCFVKSLSITLVYSQYLYDLVNNARSIFEFSNCDWTGMRSIDICLTPYGDDEGNILDDESNFLDDGQACSNSLERRIVCFADNLCRAMPRVSNLYLNIESGFNAGMVLGKQIAAAYAHQLKSLMTNRASVGAGLRFSTALTSLDIVMQNPSSDFELFSTIYADCLQDLKLRNVPGDFTWKPFLNAVKTADGASVVFGRLQKLALHFVDSYVNQEMDMPGEQQLLQIVDGIHGSRRYEFPNLACLYISTRSFEVLQNTFCTNAYRWPNVKTLEIEGYGDMNMLFGHDDTFILEQNIETLTLSIAMQMPQISRIWMSGFVEDRDSSLLLSKLVKQYSAQIKRLYTQYPVQLEFYCTLDMLECLTINSTIRYSLDFVRACAGTLKQLELDNLAHGFSWSVFSKDDSADNVVFRRLEQINIIYNTNVVDFLSDYQYFTYRHIYKVSEKPVDCPRLRKIYIGNASYCSLQNVLCFGSNRWECATALEIELANFENINSVDPHLPVFLNCLEEFAQQIVHAMPNINGFYCSGDRTNAAENRLYVSLISGYLGQLRWLWSTSPMLPTIFEREIQLESLDITFLSQIHGGSATPRICVADMNKLQLVNAPADFSWSWFVGEDGSADIVFSSLTNFSLDLDAASRRGHGQMAATGGWVQQRCVYMPKITSIAIKARERNVDLAASRLLVQIIGSISLKGPAGALPQCANSTEYSVANYIDIDVTGAAPEDKEHFYQLTNSWLQSRSFINRSWLRINHLGFDLNASLVSWDNLCSLDICCDVGFGTLVDLLRQLANLGSLHVDRLYAAELIPEIRDIEGIIYACDFVEPISTSVKSLEISGFAQGCVSNVLAASIKYLLLVVPLLEKAYVPEEVAFSIDSFIKQLGHTYPHLSNITFN